MSIFKRMASLLFEETDEEILVEDELEEVEFTSKPKRKPPYVKQEEENPQEIKHKLAPEEKLLPPKPVEEVKKFVSIEISDEKPKEAILQKPVEPPRALRDVKVRKEEKKEIKREYEFSPVISPIFGSKDEKPRSKSKPIPISLPKQKKQNNPLGTIISPYYGVSELEEFETVAHKDLKRKELSRHTILPEAEIEKMEAEQEHNSVSLADLLMDNTSSDEEDMMQISLFGESAPLKECDDMAKNKE